MSQGGKGRRTRRRGEVQIERAVVASSMREWLSDRLALAQKRSAAGLRRRSSGFGVTLEMKEISRAAAARPVEYVHAHSYDVRQPYVNPARDLKRGRRLRAELRGGAS